jgi:hypothetical protein
VISSRSLSLGLALVFFLVLTSSHHFAGGAALLASFCAWMYKMAGDRVKFYISITMHRSYLLNDGTSRLSPVFVEQTVIAL